MITFPNSLFSNIHLKLCDGYLKWWEAARQWTECYLSVTKVLPAFYMSVNWVLPECYLIVTWLLPECYLSVERQPDSGLRPEEAATAFPETETSHSWTEWHQPSNPALATTTYVSGFVATQLQLCKYSSRPFVLRLFAFVIWFCIFP